MGTRRSLLLTLALGLMAGGLGAQTPQARLWDAAIAGDTAAIAVLLELGAPIDAVNYTGFTALHHAAENGSLQATKVLL
ncbi:MAG: ankyrin repeat domain-containing protein, partial [Gemmatimonadota bacterium]